MPWPGLKKSAIWDKETFLLGKSLLILNRLMSKLSSN